eukprot:739077-Heterocapsa_arctica.AAC.1
MKQRWWGHLVHTTTGAVPGGHQKTVADSANGPAEQCSWTEGSQPADEGGTSEKTCRRGIGRRLL